MIESSRPYSAAGGESQAHRLESESAGCADTAYYKNLDEIRLPFFGGCKTVESKVGRSVEHIFINCVEIPEERVFPINCRPFLTSQRNRLSLEFPLERFELCLKIADFIFTTDANLFVIDRSSHLNKLGHRYIGKVTFTSKEKFTDFFQRFGLKRTLLDKTYKKRTKVVKHLVATRLSRRRVSRRITGCTKPNTRPSTAKSRRSALDVPRVLRRVKSESVLYGRSS